MSPGVMDASVIFPDIPHDFSLIYPSSCGYGEAAGLESLIPVAGALLICVQEGEGEIKLDGKSFRYSDGSIIADTRAELLRLRPEKVTRYMFIALENHGKLLDSIGPVLPGDPSGKLELRFETLCDRLQKKDSRDIWSASAEVYGLLMEMHAISVTAGNGLSPLVREAMRLVRSDYAFLSGVDELAERMGVNRSHLIRRFTAEAGTSPGKYLHAVRLEHAKLLLQNRDYGIDLVASMTGYSGANYFCKVFRRESGESPGAYRARTASFAASDPAVERRLREIEMMTQI